MKMTEYYNRRHQRVGTLWETRFKSMLVEGSRALQVVTAYIDLNPLRANLVQNPLDYRWCSYSEAARGNEDARQMLGYVMESEHEQWESVLADYRLLLYGLGQERTAGTHPDGVDKAKGGFTSEEIEAVWKRGGALTEWPLNPI